MLRERNVVDNGVTDVPQPIRIVSKGIDIGEVECMDSQSIILPYSEHCDISYALECTELSWLARENLGERPGIEGCHGIVVS